MSAVASARVALALSPHLDDAAFSAGGTLYALGAAGWRVVVATLFTRSVPDPQGFALRCQTDKGLVPTIDYMALRRAEDARACGHLGAEARWLPLAEAPHRGYNSAAALFAGLSGEDDVVAKLRPRLAALLAELAPDLVLAPQAIGGHVDHRALVDALDGVARPILWWRDYPYVDREARPAEPYGERFAAMDELALPLAPADAAAKLAASLAYASQLGFQFGGAGALRDRLAAAAPVERFRTEDGAAMGELLPARRPQAP